MWGYVLVILMIVSFLTGTPIYASEANESTKTYKGDNFEVTFEINNQWDNNFNGNIVIKNTGDKTIENWTLEFIMDAEIISSEENKYVVKNAGHNANIKSGQSVNFGFEAVTTDAQVSIPENYELLEVSTETTTDIGEEIDYERTGKDYKLVGRDSNGNNLRKNSDDGYNSDIHGIKYFENDYDLNYKNNKNLWHD